ncbi:PPOX class F420-dependent oxidoreductase [Dehalococcoidia bacterium]|nr:PPOX class F420-dependent oxidoreductase [Dehalococcoidia bacterium]
MIRKLTQQQAGYLAEFLAPPMIALVATIGSRGAPQLTPNWYRYVDGKLTFSTTRDRLKYRNLFKDNRISICIYSAPLAAKYATITGRAQIVEGESIWPETMAIVERYVQPEQMAARIERMHTQDRVLIRVWPERVIFGSG